jgi:hypothetical protein
VTHTIPFFGDNGKRCSTRNPHRTQVIDHLSGSCSILKSFFVPVGQRGQIPFIIWLRLRFISMHTSQSSSQVDYQEPIFITLTVPLWRNFGCLISQ